MKKKNFGNAQAQVYVDEIEQFLKYSTSHLSNAQDIVDHITNFAWEYLPHDVLGGIQKAYEYAAKAHEGQTRLSWEPYIIHPLRSTEILMNIKPDIPTIQACILHDVIEDTPYTYQDIKNAFGEVVANLCDWLVKVSKVRYRWEDRQIETLKKTFLAMATDLRVIFVKIADRIHNIQTLHFHPKPDKRKRIAMETLKIYVPICRKLWLYKYQVYLENWVFKVLYPDGYRRVLDYLNKKYSKADQTIEAWIKKIERILKKAWIKDFEVKWRLKSPFRIHEKLTKKYHTHDFSKVLDVLAFRVIVWSVGECYHTLWVIHNNYTPLIKKIKDYIAVPKFNDYQSLHTTILWMFVFPVEIQIRTEEMEQVAEYGVAAHFAYSESNQSALISEKQSKWISQLKDLVNDYKEAEEDRQEQFKTDLDIEVLNKKIFVYTPKWDVLEFPSASTLLDFAFRVHTDLWLKFKNWLVNGVIKPINYVLKTWDVVSINTFKNKITATKHWIDFLHTPTAKVKLTRHIRNQERDYYIERGIILLNNKLEQYWLPLFGHEKDKIWLLYTEDELEGYFLSFIDKKKSPLVLVRKVYAEFLALKDLESKIIQKESKAKKVVQTIEQYYEEVVIDGLKQLPYESCKLCNPHIWQKILAKVDRSWIKIHQLDCPAIRTITFDKFMEAHWKNEEINYYKVKLTITMPNESWNLVSLMTLFKQLEISIEHMSVDSYENNMFTITIESIQHNPTKISFLLKDIKAQYRFITAIKTNIA